MRMKKIASQHQMATHSVIWIQVNLKRQFGNTSIIWRKTDGRTRIISVTQMLLIYHIHRNMLSTANTIYLANIWLIAIWGDGFSLQQQRQQQHIATQRDHQPSNRPRKCDPFLNAWIRYALRRPKKAKKKYTQNNPNVMHAQIGNDNANILWFTARTHPTLIVLLLLLPLTQRPTIVRHPISTNLCLSSINYIPCTRQLVNVVLAIHCLLMRINFIWTITERHGTPSIMPWRNTYLRTYLTNFIVDIFWLLSPHKWKVLTNS